MEGLLRTVVKIMGEMIWIVQRSSSRTLPWRLEREATGETTRRVSLFVIVANDIRLVNQQPQSSVN